MRHKNLLKLIFTLFLTTNLCFGQTTVSYDFTTGGAVSGLNESTPGISLDANIGFGSFKNTGTSNPGIFSSQLRLYQNATKGGSIIFYANNGVTITDIVINGSDRTGNAGYTVDGGSQNNLTGGNTYSINSIAATSQVEFFQRDASSSNRIYIDSFSVTYTSGATTPVIGFDTATSSEVETDASFEVLIPVSLSNYDSDQIDVSVAVTGGTAETSDYTLNTTSLSFIADGTQNVSLVINPDTDDFDDETIILTLTETSAVTGLIISQSTHIITVTDDETPPSIGFDSDSSSETETNATFTSANIPITVSNYSGTQIDINVSVTGGTAEAGDYSFTSPTALSFTADGSQNVSLDINDDADTDTETVILTITETSSVTGLTISEATHTLTITDDEAPSFLVEDFTNSNATNSYADNSFLGNNDITWTYIESRNENGDANGAGIAGNALMLRRASDDSKVTSSSISTGIGSFSVKLYKGFTGSGSRQVELFINGISKGTSDTFDDNLEHTFTVDNINIVGNVIIELRNITSKQIIVDDITWTSYSSGETITWNGSESTDWATAANWDTNMVPTASDNVVIPDVTNAPVISSSTSATSNNLTITEPDGVTINTGGTLIVNGTSTGNVTYTNNLATTNWYSVSSPVSGAMYNTTWVDDNNIDTTNGTGKNIGISTYTTSDDSFSYIQSGDSGSFDSGKGYTVKQDTNGTLSFTGSINTSDVPVSVVTGGNGGFNLIGNPFTAHLNSTSFLTDNTDDLVSETIWVWNQATGVYETKIAGDNFILAPTQGFFVSANASTNLNIAESYQTTTGGTFQKNAKTEVKLLMTESKNNRFAKIYYTANATLGFDNGYDGETFGGITNSIDVFTQLLSNDSGKKYQIQSLPNSNHKNMVIPVGVKVAANKEISFSVEALNLPADINVYLEDRLTNTFTRLDEVNSSYKVTSDVALDGIGRFYLHTKNSSALNVDTVNMDNISIYKTTNSNLRVVGISQGKASIKLYSIVGKQVFEDSFTSNGIQDITLPALSTGIYIVQLETEKGNLNKKITLE